MNPIQRMPKESLIFNIKRQKMWARHYKAQNNLYTAGVCATIVRRLWAELRVHEGKS